MTVSLVPCRITYTFQCGYCPDTSEFQYYVMGGMDLYMPTMPEGWRVANGRNACPKHVITTMVQDSGTAELASMWRCDCLRHGDSIFSPSQRCSSCKQWQPSAQGSL